MLRAIFHARVARKQRRPFKRPPGVEKRGRAKTTCTALIVSSASVRRQRSSPNQGSQDWSRFSPPSRGKRFHISSHECVASQSWGRCSTYRPAQICRWSEHYLQPYAQKDTYLWYYSLSQQLRTRLPTYHLHVKIFPIFFKQYRYSSSSTRAKALANQRFVRCFQRLRHWYCQENCGCFEGEGDEKDRVGTDGFPEDSPNRARSRRGQRLERRCENYAFKR